MAGQCIFWSWTVSPATEVVVDDVDLVVQFEDLEVRPAGPATETEWSDVKAVEKATERIVEESGHLAMKRPEWIGQLGAPYRCVVATHWYLTTVLRNEFSHAYLL